MTKTQTSPREIYRETATGSTAFSFTKAIVPRVGRAVHFLTIVLAFTVHSTHEGGAKYFTIANAEKALRMTLTSGTHGSLGEGIPASVLNVLTLFAEVRTSDELGAEGVDVSVPAQTPAVGPTPGPAVPAIPGTATVELRFYWPLADGKSVSGDDGKLTESDISDFTIATDNLMAGQDSALHLDTSIGVACRVEAEEEILAAPLLGAPRRIRMVTALSSTDFEVPIVGLRTVHVILATDTSGHSDTLAAHKLTRFVGATQVSDMARADSISASAQRGVDDGFKLPLDSGVFVMFAPKPEYSDRDLPRARLVVSDNTDVWPAGTSACVVGILGHETGALQERLSDWAKSGLVPAVAGPGGTPIALEKMGRGQIRALPLVAVKRAPAGVRFMGA